MVQRHLDPITVEEEGRDFERWKLIVEPVRQVDAAGGANANRLNGCGELIRDVELMRQVEQTWKVEAASRADVES